MDKKNFILDLLNQHEGVTYLEDCAHISLRDYFGINSDKPCKDGIYIYADSECIKYTSFLEDYPHTTYEMQDGESDGPCDIYYFDVQL